MMKFGKQGNSDNAMTDGNKLLVTAVAENLLGVHYLQLNAHRLEENDSCDNQRIKMLLVPECCLMFVVFGFMEGR